MTRHAQATWILLVATLIWGASFPLTRALAEVQQANLPQAGTWFLAATTIMIRFGLSALLLLLFSLGKWVVPTALEWRQGWQLALFASGGLIFQIDGLYHTSASVSAFLTQSYCALIPLWLIFRHRRWPRAVECIAVLLVLAGVARLSGMDWGNLRPGRGEIETLVSSVFFAGQILWLERPVFRPNRSLVVSVIMFLGIAGLMLGVGVGTVDRATDMLRVITGGPSLILLIALTFFCTLLTFTAMNVWQPYVTATQAGLIYCLEPVFAAAFALFLPGWLSVWLGISSPNEPFTESLVTGGVLILAANMLVQVLPVRSKENR